MGEWLGLTAEATAAPNDTQAAFLAEARELLEHLNPVRASNTWAALLGKELTLVIPLDHAAGWPLRRRGSLHTSLQLTMRGEADRAQIVGGWHDAHYAWDYDPRTLEFEVAGYGPAARSQALDWLTKQLRRPINRDDWALFGWVVCARWRHADTDSGVEFRGFSPLGLILQGRPTRSVPAGFFDPW
jgi:hypothetical protein